MIPPKIVSPKFVSSRLVSPKVPVADSRKKGITLEYYLISIILILITVAGLFTTKRYLEAQPADPVENNISILTEAANDNPNDLEARLNLAYIYQQRENWDEAKKIYQSVLDVDSKNQGAMYNMAVIAASNKDYSVAEKGLKKLIGIYPGHLLGVVAMSKLYLEEKKPDQALDYINKGIKMSPQLADLYVMKGQAYEMKGDIKNAKIQYQTGLKYIPGLPEATQALVRLK